jgi:soluble lytic murein transglycosylase-like protein
MTRNVTTVAILAAAIWFVLPSTSHAQIASYVDEHGKLEYVNRDSPAHRVGNTISSPSAGSQALRPGFRTEFGAEQAAAAIATNGTNGSDERLDRIVRDAAERHRVDPALVKAVISTESGWNPRAISSKGAVGLMQLIPGTAQRFGVGNRFDPAQNVEGGTMYLRTLLDRYNGDLTKSLAAYNAGEGAVDRVGGVPQFPETQRYVQKVTNAYFQPDSGRNAQLWSPPRRPVRRDVDSNGRVVFTNE